MSAEMTNADASAPQRIQMSGNTCRRSGAVRARESSLQPTFVHLRSRMTFRQISRLARPRAPGDMTFPGKSGRVDYTIAPLESGTKLGLDVDYTIPVPVLGKLAEKVVFKRNQREAQMSMENIKERLEV
jgi:hypothetical protein